MMSLIDLHIFADVIFKISQKLLYITSSNLVRLYITNKGIFLKLFRNLKSDWSLAPDPFCFWQFCPLKVTGFERKNKINFLKTFWWSSFKILYFKKNFLHAMAVLGYLAKLKRGPGLAFGAHFLHDFYIKMFLFNTLLILISFNATPYFFLKISNKMCY